MAVVPVSLTLEKGTDFEATFYVTGDDGGGLNLLYSTAEAALKKHPTSKTSYNFTVGISTADSEVSISMGKTMTSVLPSGRTYFDVFLTNTELDFTSRIVTGTIIVEDTALS